LNGMVPQINLKYGNIVDLEWSFVKSQDDSPVNVSSTHITFCDIDNSGRGVGDEEKMYFTNVEEYYVASDFEFTINDSAFPEMVTVCSSEKGHFCDNPTNLDNLGVITCGGGTVDQSKRCVMLEFHDVQVIRMQFEVLGSGDRGRNFLFGGASAFFMTTTTTTTTVPKTTPPATTTLGASATEDPHVANLRGERFNINQPGGYVMFRMPQNREDPALIELRSAVRPDEGSSCGLYMRHATLTGDWLQGKKIEIRARQRNSAGSNTAGNATIAPFALKVSASSVSSTNAEHWRPFANFTAGATGVEALTDKVTVAAVTRPEFGSRLEAQAFELRFGTDPLDGRSAALIVAQASHQALNIELVRVGQLGAEFGGLLGTEAHDKKIEELTRECKAARMAGKRLHGADPMAFLSSQASGKKRAAFTASWD